MRKAMRYMGYFFFAATVLSSSVGIIALSASEEKKDSVRQPAQAAVAVSLPDEDSTIVSSLLSAIGGFGGGGLLLIFFIRRLVNSYDDTFAKLERKYEDGQQKLERQEGELSGMIKEIHAAVQCLREEIIKLQLNSVDKVIITDTVTKVSMLEDDITQVKEEVTAIMTHLLNKPRMSGGMVKGG